MHDSSKAFKAWELADDKAKLVEQRLARAWEDFFASKGSQPPDELVQEAARLRAQAREKLRGAMTDLGMDAMPPTSCL